MEKIRITESPRDAIQGLKNFIPTQAKIDYLNALLHVGFDVIDAGSFVSPTSIPQLRDMEQVLKKLDLSPTNTKLMVLIGNVKGAEKASEFEQITYLSFPFSVSKTFLKLNINSNFDKARLLIDEFLDMSVVSGKILVVYLTMAFGNPYGDKWSPDTVWKWTDTLIGTGVEHISLSDITGVATTESISKIFTVLKKEFPETDFGLHLHTTHSNWFEKVDAAYISGCRNFDSVISGFGGCPMTGYEMLGNLDTSLLIDYCEKNNISIDIDRKEFVRAVGKAAAFYALGEITV
jgi:hydroxymethylglutaryl-CoA lyase